MPKQPIEPEIVAMPWGVEGRDRLVLREMWWWRRTPDGAEERYGIATTQELELAQMLQKAGGRDAT